MFKGRRLVIATAHQKEEVIAPLLVKHLHVRCELPENFNSDQFGTFSGEIERSHSPLETLRKKCEAAIKLTNCSLAVASEGSFGAHPFIPFAQADDELVMLLDIKNDIKIVGRKLSMNLNFGSRKIKNLTELEEFASEKKFPSHNLIIKAPVDGTIMKDFRNWGDLTERLQNLLKNHEELVVETDMRALHNPTRMKVIEEATIDLINKVNSVCPNCNTPGFSAVDYKKGLPCSQCAFPTRSTLYVIHGCVKCDFTRKEYHPHGREQEEPMYCDNCNP
ncbi:MAG: DUF6671 family protein [Crocinitomicaceae bacterium]